MPTTTTTASLQPHPATPCPAIVPIDVALAFAADGALHMRYSLTGQLGELAIPAPCPPAFAHGLWQHTCQEAFIGAAEGPAYREFNFSPSGEWAVYDFGTYRIRNMAYQPATAPSIGLTQSPDALCLEARIPASLLPPGPWRIGLTAVIETRAGELSYWALSHPDQKPDFHRREAFCLSLANPASGAAA